MIKHLLVTIFCVSTMQAMETVHKPVNRNRIPFALRRQIARQSPDLQRPADRSINSFTIRRKTARQLPDFKRSVDWGRLPLDIQRLIVRQSPDFQNISKHLVETVGKPELWNNKRKIYDYSRDFVLKYHKEINIDSNVVTYWEEHFDSDGEVDDIETQRAFQVMPNKIAAWGNAGNLDIFVSFEDGSICKVTGPRQFNILHSWQAHNGAITDIECVGDKLITCGEDGCLSLWNNDGQKINQWAFENHAECNSVFIKYLKPFNLILVQNAYGDYLYFNDNLELEKKIDYKYIRQLPINHNTILTCGPHHLLEMIELQKGCTFKNLAILRSLDLAITKNRTYFLHEKEEKSLSEEPFFCFPLSFILDDLRDQKFIGKEAKSMKWAQNTIGPKAIAVVTAVTKLPWQKIVNEVAKFTINFLKSDDWDSD